MRSGKLVPIAVTTAKRSPELPNLPTIAEAGVPGYEATSWFGMFAPAGTPAPVLAKLNTALVKVLNQAEVKKNHAPIAAVRMIPNVVHSKVDGQ